MATQMMVHSVDGTELEQRRLALGLSREALGAAAGGISSATVKRVERGEVRPQPSTLSAITAALERAESRTITSGNDETPVTGASQTTDPYAAEGCHSGV